MLRAGFARNVYTYTATPSRRGVCTFTGTFLFGLGYSGSILIIILQVDLNRHLLLPSAMLISYSGLYSA